MYMREMGTVELLTREGEIEIAKRIEGGLHDMMAAISRVARPPSPRSWPWPRKSAKGEMVISTVVDGFADADEADDYVAEEDFDDYDEADDDDGKGGSKALTRKLEELKREALNRFDAVRDLFEKLQARPTRKKATAAPAYLKAQQAITAQADDDPLHRQGHREAVRHRCARQVEDVRK